MVKCSVSAIPVFGSTSFHRVIDVACRRRNVKEHPFHFLRMLKKGQVPHWVLLSIFWHENKRNRKSRKIALWWHQSHYKSRSLPKLPKFDLEVAFNIFSFFMSIYLASLQCKYLCIKWDNLQSALLWCFILEVYFTNMTILQLTILRNI